MFDLEVFKHNSTSIPKKNKVRYIKFYENDQTHFITVGHIVPSYGNIMKVKTFSINFEY